MQTHPVGIVRGSGTSKPHQPVNTVNSGIAIVAEPVHGVRRGHDVVQGAVDDVILPVGHLVRDAVQVGMTHV